MVNRKRTKGKKQLRTFRYFSEDIRREVVKKIESNELSIAQAKREYEVSATSIYRWLYRYSQYLKKGFRLIMEKKSHQEQKEQMRQRIEELERVIGQKQLEIDILNKTLELGSREAGFDIKKKCIGKLSTGMFSTKGNTATS